MNSAFEICTAVFRVTQSRMCGRKYSNEELSWAEYRETLEIIKPSPITNFQPNYNIAPTHDVPVCLNDHGERALKIMRWGLIPHWAKDAKIGYKMINARSETLSEKTSFNPLLKSRRCIVPVSGFYEWKRDGKSKQAYKIEPEGKKPMLMAGLWARNEALDVTSYTIITKAADESFSWLHHRMPVLLSQSQIAFWLTPEWDKARELIEDSATRLSIVPVSNAVGNVKNNYPELLDPIPLQGDLI